MVILLSFLPFPSPSSRLLPSPPLPSPPLSFHTAALVKHKLGESVPVPQGSFFSRKKSRSFKQRRPPDDEHDDEEEEDEEEEEGSKLGRDAFRICPDCDQLLKK